MKKVEWSKFWSRKWLLAASTFLIGVIIMAAGLAGVGESVNPWIPFAEMVVGGLIDLLAAAGFLYAEGRIDLERVKNGR